jgi:two-component system OmpR family sensor kinase
MKGRVIGQWVVAATPAVVAVAVSLATREASAASDRVAVRVSALPADWFAAFGVTLSVLLSLAVGVWQWRDRQASRALTRQRWRAANNRRRLLQRLDHELKNPLTAMRAAVANLSASDRGNEPAGALRSIEEQVVRLSRLTGDLRKIAELEAHAVKRVPIDLTELLEEVMEVVREQPQAAHRKLALHIPSAPWPLPTIDGDRDLLILALFNLLDNAIKFTAAGDVIDLRGREDSGWAVIEVADTGPGIAEDDLQLVWQELYRGQHSRGIAGSGLGLSLVKTIIEKHGGSVTIETRVDQGTVVRVSLPVPRVINR